MDELNNESSKELFEKRLGERHLQEDYLPEEDEETSIVRTVASLEVEATTLMNDIALLNGKLDQLRNLQSIVEAQGPSRITMQALQDIVGERVLPDNIPVAAFTMQSSELHKDIAMQSFDGAFGGLLAKVIQFIAKYIKVIIAAIIGLVMLVIGLGGSGSSGGGGGGGGGSSSTRSVVRVPNSNRSLDVKKPSDFAILKRILADNSAKLKAYPDITAHLDQLLVNQRAIHNSRMDEEIFEGFKDGSITAQVADVHGYTITMLHFGTRISSIIADLAEAGEKAMSTPFAKNRVNFIEDMVRAGTDIMKCGIIGYTLKPICDAKLAEELGLRDIPVGIINGTRLTPSQAKYRAEYDRVVELSSENVFALPFYKLPTTDAKLPKLENSDWLSRASHDGLKNANFYSPHELDERSEELAACSLIHTKNYKLLTDGVSSLDEKSKNAGKWLKTLADRAKKFNMVGDKMGYVAQWPPSGNGIPDYVNSGESRANIPEEHERYTMQNAIKLLFSLTGGPCMVAIDALKVIGAQTRDAKVFLDASDRVVRSVYEFRYLSGTCLDKVIEEESKK